MAALKIKKTDERYCMYAVPEQIPQSFQKLAACGCLTEQDVMCTSDGFFAVTKSVADILIEKGINTFPNSQDQELDCDKFFDDWYLYSVPGNGADVYSLFKMREQEHDTENGGIADGDDPGVTVCFIEFDIEILSLCIDDPSFANRKALNQEINRVVAYRGQKHHEALKAYFRRPESEGSYLIAELYVLFLASLANNGCLAVPDSYASAYRKSMSAGSSRKKGRLPRFIDTNNELAGYTVCDHENIYLQDSEQLSVYEKNALLATHTADTSFHSFAAEVRYHACFLAWYAKVPIPVIGRSAYASAIRADMTISENEFEFPAPFHNPRSRCIRTQVKYHNTYN